MENRGKWAIGGSILGGIAAAASLGKLVTLPDNLIGSAIMGGITFGIASLKVSRRIDVNEPSGLKSYSPTTMPLSSSKYEFDLSDEMRDFLNSLELIPGRSDGWHKDPANLFNFRFLYKGKWTLAVCDSENELEKSAALSAFLRTIKSEKPMPVDAEIISGLESQAVLKPRKAQTPGTTVSNQAEVNSIVGQLERLASLHAAKVITDQELEELKRKLLS